MSIFLGLKMRYPISSEGYDCVAFRATAGEHSTHYAYAYWRHDTDLLEPEYVCLSPTFESRDGEYRHRFIGGGVFLSEYTRLAKTLEPIEQAVIELVASDAIKLGNNAYPRENNQDIAEKAKTLRLGVVLFTALLGLDTWELSRGLLALHTNDGFKNILSGSVAAHPVIMEVSQQLCAGIELHKLRFGVSELNLRCGQKLVPMYLRETLQEFDINLSAWRELAVIKIVGDLVINFISPSFPIYNQWAVLEGTDAQLFDNQAMEERYRRSEEVSTATNKIRSARQNLMHPKDPSNTTTELSAQLYESLLYAQSFLLMAPTTMLHTMEHVGWTLANHGGAIRRATSAAPQATAAFANKNMGARHLFEFVYAAHCLHSKMGVVHGDIHANNLTLYSWAKSHYRPNPADAKHLAPYFEDPVVLYAAGPRGSLDSYVFPASGMTGCIIDYSRALLGPAAGPRIVAEHGARYATNFYRDQTNRVMRALHRHAPTYVAANQDAIKAAVLGDFGAVFPVLAATDFVMIGLAAGLALEADAKTTAPEFADPYALRPSPVAPELLALAKKIETLGRDLLVRGLHDLVHRKRAAGGPVWPGDTVMAKVFGDWQFARWAAREPERLRTAQLVDAWNWNNPVAYSATNYDKFPPWGRFENIERHLGEYKMTDVFERGIEPFLASLEPGARFEVQAEALRAEQERLDGPPVATGSSWID